VRESRVEMIGVGWEPVCQFVDDVTADRGVSLAKKLLHLSDCGLRQSDYVDSCDAGSAAMSRPNVRVAERRVVRPARGRALLEAVQPQFSQRPRAYKSPFNNGPFPNEALSTSSYASLRLPLAPIVPPLSVLLIPCGLTWAGASGRSMSGTDLAITHFLFSASS
jgi:hypothetical protein